MLVWTVSPLRARFLAALVLGLVLAWCSPPRARALAPASPDSLAPVGTGAAHSARADSLARAESLVPAPAAGTADTLGTSPPGSPGFAARSGTAVLCEALVFIEYAEQQDRILVRESRRVGDELVRAVAKSLRRAGRSAGPAVYASSGILLDPTQEYRLAWERPARERPAIPPTARPPFHADARLAAGESTLADWRELARRASVHDSTDAPEAVRLAREIGAAEVLVVVARGSRTTAKERLRSEGNPFAGMVDEERMYDAWTSIDLALYEAGEGRRLWGFADQENGWNANSAKRLGEWTGAAVELMPPPGARGGENDVTSAGFRAPYRADITVRVGGVSVGGDDTAFLLGTRGTYVFRPWLSAGFQLDWQAIRASRYALHGSGSFGGVPIASVRELRDAKLDLFPLYPVLQMDLPRFLWATPSAGLSGGYALAFLESPDYELQILGSWGWATHAGLWWRAAHGPVGLGIEWMLQRARPERDGTDPLTGAPVRERLDLNGWGLGLSFRLWE